ncbi:hypothetical protein HDV00_009462 [Rhizophlyctis rosea]|nr:hypothetical protein HDV00_009462 [Rhizophlyctis rosea]
MKGRKAETMFGKLPLLKIMHPDGREVVLSQSQTIVRLLGRRFGLDGEGEEDRALVEMIQDEWLDFQWSYNWTFASNLEGVKDRVKVENYRDSTILPFIKNHEKYLEKNGAKGHYVGDEITVADLATFQTISWVQNTPFKAVFTRAAAPNIYRVYDTVAVHPRIKALSLLSVKDDDAANDDEVGLDEPGQEEESGMLLLLPPMRIPAVTASVIFVHIVPGDLIIGSDSSGDFVYGRMVRDLSKRTRLQGGDVEMFGVEAERTVDVGRSDGFMVSDGDAKSEWDDDGFGGVAGGMVDSKEEEDNGDVGESGGISSSPAGPGPISTFGVRRLTAMGIGAVVMRVDFVGWKGSDLSDGEGDAKLGKKVAKAFSL